MKDQLDRTIIIEKTPNRIISLVPSQTELLVDLGLEEAIVGVTKFCVHPEGLKENKTIVGGTKQVHYDKIRRLQPDIILCNKEENTKDMIVELEKIAPVHISDVNTVDEAIQLIELYGVLFSKEKKAQEIIDGINQKKLEFQKLIKPTSKSVAYFIWKEPWMIAAKNTFINDLLQLNGFENYFKNLERYPEVHLQTIQPESASVVLLSTEPYPFKETHIKDIEIYFPNAKIFVVDGEMFSWYGSRLLKAFDYFKALHQDQWS